MPNRLAEETSPYLLQHANNPVDWYPWGEEALRIAEEEDKPILLSIGYSACHWCHVMERESFEDEETAAIMNEGFVSIKVDREERPDLDSIYMRAVQASVGRGGWPLTAFLTPDGRFFHGGTYYPPEPRHGMPSFRQVLAAVLGAYRTRREEVEEGSDRLLAYLRGASAPGGGRGSGSLGATETVGSEGAAEGVGENKLAAIGPRTLDQATQTLADQFDPLQGGFGPAPKFPQPVTLEFLMRDFYRTGKKETVEMALTTLRAMARGGIRDHLGGGFHRYSVDDRWLVPHFEKMLYDNGLLARVYLHAYQITGEVELREVTTSILDYLLDDLRDSNGGFYSARDADSEGEEGLYYLWRPEEIDEVLGDDGPFLRRLYGVTRTGNFEGRSILHLDRDVDIPSETGDPTRGEALARLEGARKSLVEARKRREAPLRDEKVLAAWNAFVLRALAEAGAVLGRADYLGAARDNAVFLLDSLRKGHRLYRSWKDGKSRIPAFLEDYAALGNALLTLYECSLEPRWLEEARNTADQLLDLFWDGEEGVFYDSARDGEVLVVRPREITDSATPSGTSLSVELMLRLAHIFGEGSYRSVANRTLLRELEGMGRFPSAFGRLLSTLCMALTPPLEVTLLSEAGGPGLAAFVSAAHRFYLPSRTVVGGDPRRLPPLPLLEGRAPTDDGPTAFVCRGFSCSAPIRDARALAVELEGSTRSP